MQICHETMYYVLSFHILKWKTPSVEHKAAAHNCSLHTETGNVKYQTTIEQWPPKTSSTLQESTYIFLKKKIIFAALPKIPQGSSQDFSMPWILVAIGCRRRRDGVHFAVNRSSPDCRTPSVNLQTQAR